VNGSLSLPVRTVNNTSLIGMGDNDYLVIVTGTTAASVILPQAGATGRVYAIKNRATTTILVGFQAAGPLIEGNATLSVPTNTVVQVICDGTNWFKIN
jgi:hypothetical protein